MSDPINFGNAQPPQAGFIQNPPPAVPSPPPVPTMTPPQASQPVAAAPPVVPLTVDEYQRLRGLERQLADFQAQQAAALQAAEEVRLKLVADKEGAEKALAEQRMSWETRLNEEKNARMQFEQTIFEERRERIFADQLAGREFFGDTDEHREIISRQVKNELRNRFETTRDASGQLVVREKGTGMPADVVLPKLLDSMEFGHFFKARGKGGGMPQPPLPYQPGAGSGFEPGSLQDIAAEWKRAQGQFPGMGLSPTVSK